MYLVTHTLFFLANNLYGSMETLKLPVSNFAWLTKKEVQHMTAKNIIRLSAQDDIGYAFEVDLQYPNHLHKVIKICKYKNSFIIVFLFFSIMISFLWHLILVICHLVIYRPSTNDFFKNPFPAILQIKDTEVKNF